MRVYPSGSTAAHVLGYLRSNDDSQQGETAVLITGCRIIAAWAARKAGSTRNTRARGQGIRPRQHLGYRQSENIWKRPDPGKNIVLTIDFDIQGAAENHFWNIGARR